LTAYVRNRTERGPNRYQEFIQGIVLRLGLRMGILMVQCPATGREISTGIELDDSRFRSGPVFFGSTFCPFCRTHHEWFAKDAWISEGPSASRLRSSPMASDTGASPASASAPVRGSRQAEIPLGETIVRLNIEHFRKLLSKQLDPIQRQTIARLLGEEEAKLQALEGPSRAERARRQA
jgi:hypothetical protein